MRATASASSTGSALPDGTTRWRFPAPRSSPNWKAVRESGPYAAFGRRRDGVALQLKSLKKAEGQKIFREKVSGFNRERPEFRRMLDQIRPGDIAIVWKLDRLARSTRDLLNTMDTINEAGGKSQSVSEPWADTTTQAGKMIMTIFCGYC